MDYENVYFNPDVVALYSRKRKLMAVKFMVELRNKWQELAKPKERHAYGVFQNDTGQPRLSKTDPGWKNMSQITTGPGSCK